MTKHPSQLARIYKILKKIPMFRGMSMEQALEVIAICEWRIIQVDDVVCRYGSKSDKMHILLSGALDVFAEDGTKLTTLRPVTTVGEMGFIAGLDRAATVVAAERADTFGISRAAFQRVLHRFPELGVLVLRNVVDTLARRIDSTNQQVVEYRWKAEGREPNEDEAEHTGPAIGRGFVRPREKAHGVGG